MKDIVTRIRQYDCSDGGHSDAVGATIYELAEEAACEIEELREALRLTGRTLTRAITDIQSELPKS